MSLSAPRIFTRENGGGGEWGGGELEERGEEEQPVKTNTKIIRFEGKSNKLALFSQKR